jgi:hypothetical protein
MAGSQGSISTAVAYLAKLNCASIIVTMSITKSTTMDAGQQNVFIYIASATSNYSANPACRAT